MFLLRLHRLIWHILLLFLVSFTVGAAQAGTLKTTSPKRAGMSAERLTRIDEHMNRAIESGEMIGGLGLIARDGRVVYLREFGHADLNPKRPMTKDTLFRIYSMTKPITSVAVLMLYEEGHFLLNDPVAKYLPELANLQVALSTADNNDKGMLSNGIVSKHKAEGDSALRGKTRQPRRQPTIRDLLTHTAGFTYGLFGNTEVDELYRTTHIAHNTTNLENFVRQLGQLPLQYEPGSRWHYSVATDVLARLVEVVSGQSFDAFLSDRLFTPLGMNDTDFTVNEEEQKRFAQLYSPSGISSELGTAFLNDSWSGKLEEAPESFDQNFMPGATFKSGGGGLVSTISDYLVFCQMLLNGGEFDGKRILSPKTIELMTMDHLASQGSVFGRGGTGFGLGVSVMSNLAEKGELGSNGMYMWGGAAGTKFFIDPTEKLIGIFMTQSIPHLGQIGVDFNYLIYQAIEESYHK